MMTAAKTLVKSLILPAEPGCVRTRFGFAAGHLIYVHPQHSLRRYLGVDERELKPHFRKLVQPGDRCFDVGSETGYYAVSLAALTNAKVVAFEADSGRAKILRSVVAANDLDNTPIEQFVSNQNTPTSITLDAAAEQFFVPDFLKVDIEGHEAAALEGAEGILAERTARLIVEVHGREIEALCIKILRRHRYDVRVVDHARFLGERRYRKIEHNRWLVAVP